MSTFDEVQKKSSRKPKQRRDRSARVNEAELSAPAYIQRKIPYYDFLSEDSLYKIEEHVEWLLQEVGVEFRDDEKALAIWREAGADVDGVRVRMPNGMARELCKTIPSEFTQYARNPKYNVVIGGNNTVYSPVHCPPFVRDLDGGRRYGSLEDLYNLIKIVYQIPWLHHSGGIIVEPCDIAVNKRHLDIVYGHMRLFRESFLRRYNLKR